MSKVHSEFTLFWKVPLQLFLSVNESHFYNDVQLHSAYLPPKSIVCVLPASNLKFASIHLKQQYLFASSS